MYNVVPDHTHAYEGGKVTCSECGHNGVPEWDGYNGVYICVVCYAEVAVSEEE